MGTQYNGKPANVTYAAPVAITDSTNTSPIAILTSAPHGLQNGDTVDVQGHQTNTPANGVWPVVVSGLSVLELVGSAGIAAGGATGTVQSLAAGATIQVPADGDTYAAATYAPGYSGLADRTAAQSVATGAYKVVNIVTALTSADSNTVWANLSSCGPAWSLANVPVIWAVTGAVLGDIIDVTLACTAQCNNLGAYALFSLLYATQLPGSARSVFSKFSASNQGITPGSTIPMTLRATAETSTAAYFFTLGFYGNGSGPAMSAQSDYQFTAILYRPTGFPQ